MNLWNNSSHNIGICETKNIDINDRIVGCPQGSPTARVRMGDHHYYGWGTAVDHAAAASHYSLATELHRNAQAMFNMGYMHEHGKGLAQVRDAKIHVHLS